MTTRVKWILGITAALAGGGIVLLVRSGRKRRAQELEVQAQAMVQADVGLTAPAGANRVVKYGVELLNGSGLTEFQFEALWQAMQSQQTIIPADAREKIVAYFAQKQPAEHAAWKKHNHGKGLAAASDKAAYPKLVATALRDMMKLRPEVPAPKVTLAPPVPA